MRTSTNPLANNNNFYLNTVKINIEANTVYGAVYILIKNMLMKKHNRNYHSFKIFPRF